MRKRRSSVPRPSLDTRAITQAIGRRFFDPYEPVHALVAVRGDDLFGVAHYLFHRNTLMQRGTCYLQDLFTSEAARGKGVGRRLIQAVYEQAKNAGAPTAVMAGEARCRRSTKSAEFRRSSATVLPTSSGEYELVPNPAKPVDSEWAKNKYPQRRRTGVRRLTPFYHHGRAPLAENVSCLSHIRRLS